MSTDVKTIPQAEHVAPNGVKLPVYMDNHATTPMDPRVLEEMLPYFMEKFGNAASRNHSFGWAGEEGVETARERVAKLIGATTKEIIFTSGATESDNLAIKGVAEMYQEKGNHIITAVTEHKAVLDTCKRLEKYGYRVTYLPVQKDGLIDLEELKRAMDDKTILVTIMAANNEIGVLQPVAEIGKLCRERGVIFHTDATQAVGKIPVDVNKKNIDVMSISAHKMYGPKGVGRIVCAAQESPRADFRHHRRRRPRARHAFGNAERSRNCGSGQGLRDCVGRNGEGILQTGRPAQPPARQNHGPPGRGLHQRLVGASSARQPEHQLCLRRRRVAADGHQRHRGFERFGLHLGDAGAILCIEGSGHRRRSGAQLDSLRPRTLQHRSRSRLRSRSRGRNGVAAARTFAALRNGERRRGFEEREVGSRVSRNRRNNCLQSFEFSG